MSLRNLTDEQVAAFRKDPLSFLGVEDNYAAVFGRSAEYVSEKAAAALRGLGKPKDHFAYNIEETK